MNAAAKGTRLEREFERWLQARGWRTYRPPRSRFSKSRFQGGVDIFGWGDILAAKPGTRPLLVQVTTAGKAHVHRAELREGKLGDRLTFSGFTLVLAVSHGNVPSDDPRAIRGWRCQAWAKADEGHVLTAPFAPEHATYLADGFLLEEGYLTPAEMRG